MERVTLQEFKQLAYRAFSWTSFDPQKRSENTLQEHEDQLNDDLQNIPESETDRYIQSYKKYFSEWLSAHSKCASSVITGGSGFNVSRAEKANNREHVKYGQFIEWREKALKAIARKIEESLSDKAEKENTEIAFKGGKVVNNYQENRIQLIFDEKPSSELISQLKRSAFKWSPRFGAWQRQMTGNGVYAVNSFLKTNNLFILDISII
jgi:hypothetical protein